MRDINRIDGFCDRLKEVWKQVPDWRFGQLMCNTLGDVGMDPFFIEDEPLIKRLEEIMEVKK